MNQIKDIDKGDAFAFQTLDQKYKAILCIRTYKERSPFAFDFAALDIDQENKPELNDIKAAHFYGTGRSNDSYFYYSETEKAKMWKVHPEIHPYILGAYGLMISRKDFMKARDQFHFLGNLNIVEHLEKHSGGSMNASDWIFLREFFSNKLKTVFSERDLSLYKVAAIIRD